MAKQFQQIHTFSSRHVQFSPLCPSYYPTFQQPYFSTTTAAETPRNSLESSGNNSTAHAAAFPTQTHTITSSSWSKPKPKPASAPSNDIIFSSRIEGSIQMHPTTLVTYADGSQRVINAVNTYSTATYQYPELPSPFRQLNPTTAFNTGPGAFLRRPTFTSNKLNPNLFNPTKGGNLFKVLRVRTTRNGTETLMPSPPKHYSNKQQNPFNNKCKRPSEIIQDLREEFKRKKEEDQESGFQLNDGLDFVKPNTSTETDESAKYKAAAPTKKKSGLLKNRKALPKLLFYGVPPTRSKNTFADSSCSDNSVFINKGKSRISHVGLDNIEGVLERERRLQNISLKLKQDFPDDLKDIDCEEVLTTTSVETTAGSAYKDRVIMGGTVTNIPSKTIKKGRGRKRKSDSATVVIKLKKKNSVIPSYFKPVNQKYQTRHKFLTNKPLKKKIIFKLGGRQVGHGHECSEVLDSQTQAEEGGQDDENNEMEYTSESILEANNHIIVKIKKSKVPASPVHHYAAQYPIIKFQ